MNIVNLLRDSSPVSDHSSNSGEDSPTGCEEDREQYDRPESRLDFRYVLRSDTELALPAIMEEDGASVIQSTSPVQELIICDETEPSSKQTTPVMEHRSVTSLYSGQPAMPLSPPSDSDEHGRVSSPAPSLTIHPINTPIATPEPPEIKAGIPSSPLLSNPRKHRAPASDSDRDATPSPSFAFLQDKDHGRKVTSAPQNADARKRSYTGADGNDCPSGWRGSWSRFRGKRRRKNASGADTDAESQSMTMSGRASSMRKSVSSSRSLFAASAGPRLATVFCMPVGVAASKQVARE